MSVEFIWNLYLQIKKYLTSLFQAEKFPNLFIVFIHGLIEILIWKLIILNDSFYNDKLKNL